MEIEIESPLGLWFIQEIPSSNWVEFIHVKYFWEYMYIPILGGNTSTSRIRRITHLIATSVDQTIKCLCSESDSELLFA